MTLQITRRSALISLNRIICVVSLLALALTFLGVAGCASVSPTPFNAFATSIQQLREGSDSSLSIVYQRSRDRFIEEAGAGDEAKVNALMLTQISGDPFGWTWASQNPPIFFTTARFRTGVYQLNSVLVNYSGLLEQLASPDLVSLETFNQMAKDLNGNLKTAVQAFGVSAPPDKEFAIISTTATAAFRAYLQNKQRSSLLEALSNNQEAIQDAAELAAQAVRITAAALRSEYDLRSLNLATRVTKPTLSVSDKQVAIRELVDMDDKFIKEIFVLKTLHDSYKTLPAAHRDLAVGLTDPKKGLPMVRELFENGRELYRLYEELSKEDKKKGVTP